MSVISSPIDKPSFWQVLLFITLAFWLSSCLTLDGLVMPSMYVSGMMAQPGFASGGYSLFWLFNRVEVLCAALVLTSILVLRYARHPWNRPGYFAVFASTLLLAIALLDTYGLTPSMSALGLQLDWFSAASFPSAEMGSLHLSYWGLEVLKVAVCSALLWLYSRRSVAFNQ